MSGLLLLILAVIIVLYILLINHPWSLRTPSYVKLNRDTRKLWSDHVHWTREYIIMAIEDLPRKQYVAQRLFKNQDDIGQAFGKYYGKEAGKKLAGLLHTHIELAAKIIDELRAQTTPEDDVKQWYANGDEIADFLQKHNPHYWGHAREMMKIHLDTTIDEVTKYLKAKNNQMTIDQLNQRESDILSFERVLSHMLIFADMLSDGIATQNAWLFLM